MIPDTPLQRAASALEAMAAEFRALDLPYGSKAYAQATTVLNELRACQREEPVMKIAVVLFEITYAMEVAMTDEETKRDQIAKKATYVFRELMAADSFQLDGGPLLSGWYDHNEDGNTEGGLDPEMADEMALHATWDSEGLVFEEILTVGDLCNATIQDDGVIRIPRKDGDVEVSAYRHVSALRPMDPKIKTSELTGAALDWAVAKCEGTLPASYDDWKQTWPRYSTNWAQGGPIIGREAHNLFKHNGGTEWCCACNVPRDGYTAIVTADGPTPLIAAMRCFCASKLGDEVEVPEELV